MKPAPFAYLRAGSVREAVSALRDDDGAKVLAGGQSLMPLLALRMARPTLLVDVLALPELTGSRSADGGYRVGATVRQRAAERDPVIHERLPVLAAAIGHVGHLQTRSRGTVGGSVAHLDPTGEIPAVAVLLGATVHVAGPDGDRDVAMEEFAQGPYWPALEPGEVVLAVTFPWLPAAARWSFHEVARRHGDLALALAAGVLADGAARVVVGAIDDVPRRLPELESALGRGEVRPADVRDAARAALADVAIGGNLVDGGAEHRRALAETTVARVLADLLADAGAPRVARPDGRA